MNEKFDKTNPKSIESYAKKLINQTFKDVLDNSEYISSAEKDKIADQYGNKKRKGGLGNLLEEAYFGYKANSSPEPDFKDAGVELKVTPFGKKADGSIKAGERLVLTMINYSGEIEETLYDSHLWHKCKLLLLIYYWRNRLIYNNLNYPIHFVSLFTPPSEDLAIIENDYKIIADKVMAGKADELSESDTMYLGACTKGASAEKGTVNQYYPPHKPAMKRAFCYKISYMNYVLNQYIIPEKETYEAIIDDVSELKDKSFEEYITSKIDSYIGKSDRELCKLFGREYNNNKAQWTDLSYRMLGIKSNKAAEFKKANIVVKVIRLEENGKMKEHMSFPVFKYQEIIKEEWDDSTLHNYFDETKFLFVVFRSNGKEFVLQGCQLWNMPYEDLNNIVRDGWEKVVNTIKDGVQLTIEQTSNGPVVRNNFPSRKDNEIIHVRPHAQRAYYKLADGTVIGEGQLTNANPLPDGTWMTNHCFWINNDYILKQLKCLNKN